MPPITFAIVALLTIVPPPYEPLADPRYQIVILRNWPERFRNALYFELMARYSAINAGIYAIAVLLFLFGGTRPQHAAIALGATFAFGTFMFFAYACIWMIA